MTKRTVKQYSDEFKQSSVELVTSSDKSVSQIARELGINTNTLHGWIKKYSKSLPHVNSEEELRLKQELAQLKKENARLKQERDILKKAAAYFASETQ